MICIRKTIFLVNMAVHLTECGSAFRPSGRVFSEIGAVLPRLNFLVDG